MSLHLSKFNVKDSLCNYHLAVSINTAQTVLNLSNPYLASITEGLGGDKALKYDLIMLELFYKSKGDVQM